MAPADTAVTVRRTVTESRRVRGRMIGEAPAAKTAPGRPPCQRPAAGQG